MRTNRRRHQRGQTVLDFSVIMAVFMTVIVLIGSYVKGSVGHKYKEAADQISEGQFDPKRGTFNMTSNSSSKRTENVTTKGITTSTIEDEQSHRDITQNNTRPTAADKLFDASW